MPESAGAVSALDRGLLLGDGLFETMRVLGGRVLQWNRHWERLHRGAGALGLTLPWTAGDLQKVVGQTLAANQLREAIVRLTVTRGFSPTARGLPPPADAWPTLIIRAAPFTPYPQHLYQNGMRVVVSRRTRRNERSPLSRVKSLNYLDNVIARQEAVAHGADEALLLNTQGNAACATTANIFTVRGGRLQTPAVAAGALQGTVRALVRAELAPGISHVVETTQLSATDLRQADELFLTNALMGIMPVCAVDGRPVGSGQPGPLTRKLLVAYESWLGSCVKALESTT